MERRRNVFFEALNNSTSRHSRLKSRIQFQAQETERLMRQHFQTLHQFLKEEEENRVAALKDEEHRKMEELETSEEQRIQAVLFRARAVEGDLGDNGATFQEDLGSVQQRAQNNVPDPAPDSRFMIDVATHLGNLRYCVWEKMKELCPHCEWGLFLQDMARPHSNLALRCMMMYIDKRIRKRTLVFIIFLLLIVLLVIVFVFVKWVDHIQWKI